MTATELVQQTELSEEIYNDSEYLSNLFIALEDAIDVVYELEEKKQENNELLENNERITDENIQSTNDIINYSCNILGNESDYEKYKINLESDMTRYEMLKLSTEGLSDIIEKIKDKIIATFHRVVAFFQRQYVKILAWINPYKKQLKKLKEKINKLTDNTISIYINSYDVKKSISKLTDLSPDVSKVYLKTNDTDNILRNILKEECDASKFFDRLLNNTKLKELLNNLCEVKPNANCFTKLEEGLSDYEKGCVLLCRVRHKTYNFIISKKVDNKVELEYKIFDSDKENFELPRFGIDTSDIHKDSTINKQDLLNYINNLDNKLISKLTDSVKDIIKVQDNLINIVKEQIKKGNIDKSSNAGVKAAVYIGARASIDNVFWMLDTIKASIKLIDGISKKASENFYNPDTDIKKLDYDKFTSDIEDNMRDLAKEKIKPYQDEIKRSSEKTRKSLDELKDMNSKLMQTLKK